MSLAHFAAEFFEGPLPHPNTLAHYERICPGAADRLLTLAEGQARHRQELESLVVTSNCRAQDRGPILGFTLALCIVVLGGALILNGREISGLIALVSALVAIVIPFIYGKREQKRLQEKKDRPVRWDSSTAPAGPARRSRKGISEEHGQREAQVARK